MLTRKEAKHKPDRRRRREYPNWDHLLMPKARRGDTPCPHCDGYLRGEPLPDLVVALWGNAADASLLAHREPLCSQARRFLAANAGRLYGPAEDRWLRENQGRYGKIDGAPPWEKLRPQSTSIFSE